MGGVYFQAFRVLGSIQFFMLLDEGPQFLASRPPRAPLSSLVHGLSQHGSFPPQSEESMESPSKADVAVFCNVNPGSDILSTLPYSSGYKHYRFHPCSRGLDYTRVGVPGGGNNWE